jgi:hypothetical protein
MELGVIIAIVGSVMAMIGATITMMLWVRSESRSDCRNLQDQIVTDRREFISLMSEIKLENRDFHHRLLEIERSRR